ncbi:uncharacterized protein isoform X2 [Musca autumnalis]|uniref:uncharacterized protein isoform X2 n=1 Tax=Musca autumnalis TaxID=221902 RepID=UPI003CF6EFD0
MACRSSHNKAKGSTKKLHDIIAENVVLDTNMVKLIMLDVGDYMFRLMVAAYNNWKAEINFYFSIYK